MLEMNLCFSKLLSPCRTNFNFIQFQG